jgi:hypothetical protein
MDRDAAWTASTDGAALSPPAALAPLAAAGTPPKDLLRAHVASRLAHVRTRYPPPKMEREAAASLWLLHTIAQHPAHESEGPTGNALRKAMRELCEELLLSTDAASLSHDPDACRAACAALCGDDASSDANAMEVAYFPVAIAYNATCRPPRHVRWMQPMTSSPCDDRVSITWVPAHLGVKLSPVTLEGGRLALFVFRVPKVLRVRVSDATSEEVGLTQHGCHLFVHHDVASLEKAADLFTLGHGAQWVWWHAKADTYRTGPRTARAHGHSTLTLPDRGVVLQRRALRWCFGKA